MKPGNMHQIDFTFISEGDLEKEDSANKEAAWKHIRPFLRCGQSEMEFRATGHKAADLHLDIGIVLVNLFYLMLSVFLMSSAFLLPQVLLTPCLWTRSLKPVDTQ